MNEVHVISVVIDSRVVVIEAYDNEIAASIRETDLTRKYFQIDYTIDRKVLEVKHCAPYPTARVHQFSQVGDLA
jgi:hypothetical protein